jgi:hypothetical protein
MQRQKKIIKTDILYKVVIPCAVVIILILFLSNILTLKLNFTGDFSAELLHLISAVIIAFVGVYLYVYKNRDEELNYLELGLEVIHEEEYLKVRTELSNPTDFDRDVYSAFLIISKSGSPILDIVNSEFQYNFTDTNSLIGLKDKSIHLKENFAFIPLKYYFQENVRVGNEKLIYEVPIKSRRNTNNELNFFDVRFFVFRDRKDLNTYHRSVACSFGIKGNLNLDHLIGLASISETIENIKK